MFVVGSGTGCSLQRVAVCVRELLAAVHDCRWFQWRFQATFSSALPSLLQSRPRAATLTQRRWRPNQTEGLFFTGNQSAGSSHRSWFGTVSASFGCGPEQKDVLHLKCPSGSVGWAEGPRSPIASCSAPKTPKKTRPIHPQTLQIFPVSGLAM